MVIRLLIIFLLLQYVNLLKNNLFIFVPIVPIYKKVELVIAILLGS